MQRRHRTQKRLSLSHLPRWSCLLAASLWLQQQTGWSILRKVKRKRDKNCIFNLSSNQADDRCATKGQAFQTLNRITLWCNKRLLLSMLQWKTLLHSTCLVVLNAKRSGLASLVNTVLALIGMRVSMSLHHALLDLNLWMCVACHFRHNPIRGLLPVNCHPSQPRKAPKSLCVGVVKWEMSNYWKWFAWVGRHV